MCFIVPKISIDIITCFFIDVMLSIDKKSYMAINSCHFISETIQHSSKTGCKKCWKVKKENPGTWSNTGGGVASVTAKSRSWFFPVSHLPVFNRLWKRRMEGSHRFSFKKMRRWETVADRFYLNVNEKMVRKFKLMEVAPLSLELLF